MTTSARRAIIVLVACATCLTLTGCGPSAKQRVDLVADRVLREHYGKNGGDTTVGEKEISALRAIVKGRPRGIARRHAHAQHLLRPQRIHRDGGGKR